MAKLVMSLPSLPFIFMLFNPIIHSNFLQMSKPCYAYKEYHEFSIPMHKHENKDVWLHRDWTLHFFCHLGKHQLSSNSALFRELYENMHFWLNLSISSQRKNYKVSHLQISVDSNSRIFHNTSIQDHYKHHPCTTIQLMMLYQCKVK